MDNRKSIIFKQIGVKIAYFRTVRGLTQNSLANKINISLNTLGKIERGKYNKNLSISMLFDIAEGLQIDMVLLLTFTEDEKRVWLEEADKID